MGVSEMRRAISRVYASKSWKEKVRDMPDYQVIAIYYDFSKRDKLNKKPINKKVAEQITIDEYTKRKKKRLRTKIIAVDFDGTLCENKWPEIGEPNWEVIDYIKEEKWLGAKLILWTCRSGDELLSALVYCNAWGIEFDAVNANLPESIERFGGDARKIFADEYIDDRLCKKFKLPFKVKKGGLI